MSIWKDLYELFASERHRWQSQDALKNAYSKIQTLKKLSAVNNSDDHGRKLKALLRFLILLLTHIEQRTLGKPAR